MTEPNLSAGGAHALIDTADTPLPRAPRRRRKAKEERGLPPDEELARLAAEYLQRQRKHWPELVKAGLLSEPSETIIRSMVDDFKARHRGDPVDPALAKLFLKYRLKLGGNYNRYSCDNSDPKSITDQMVKCLDKAHNEGRFIPWCYVFADYSVSGLDASRQGYIAYKELLVDENQPLDTTYIDDFSRASRNELEWWKLAAHSKQRNKRLIGASDDFDLSNPNWDIWVTVFGLLSRLFIRGLRQKVLRGMRGTARKGGSVGKPPLGFTLKLQRDQRGNILLGRNDRPKKEPCWDPATKDDAYRVFEWFAVQNRTPYWITKEFNRLKVDGWDGWTVAAIKKMLRNPAYIGVFVWNKTRREYDLDSERWVVVKNPRSEWEVYYNPKLAIIPMDWWRTTRRKLAATRRASRNTGRKPSRNEISATTLFSGALFCECKGEMKLIRSAGEYQQMGCLNGPIGAHGCKLTSSKSVRVIEDSLLRYLRDTVLTDASLEALVTKANAIVEQEASKPPVDTAMWKAEARKKDAKIRKLVLRIEEEPDEKLCGAYHDRVKQLQKEVNELQARISEAEAHQRKKPQPVSLTTAKQYLADFRGTLNQDIPVAAEAIRTLTGPITIRQETIPGRKNGARWIATFGPDLARVLYLVAKGHGDRQFTFGSAPAVLPKVEVPIEKIPKYVTLAPLFKQEYDRGVSIETLAAVHHMSWQYAKEILHFAQTGERPQWRSARRTGRGQRTRYTEIAEEVVDLRDNQKMSFKKIAAKLRVTPGTARRAYDHLRPEAVSAAVERGVAPHRGRYSHLGEEVYERIRQLLRDGNQPPAIAAQVGCGTSTVYRVRREMRDEPV